MLEAVLAQLLDAPMSVLAACAACVDPSSAMPAVGLGTGVVGATAAAGGAGAGAARGGPFSDPMRNPRLPGPEDDVGDATSPYQQREGAKEGVERPGSPMLDVSRQVQKWVEHWTGTGIIGTVPAGGKG